MVAPSGRLQPGSRLGPYEIRAFIGAGGMGTVFRARDPRVGRDVAIKVLSEAFRGDAAWLARFEREGRAIGAINHPNVIALYDVGTYDDMPYLVCELLDGATLRDRLRSETFGWQRAVDLAQQIARGLAALHERGLTHRDLKPGNLFVTPDGVVKILDFGLVKLSPPSDATLALDATLSADALVPPDLTEPGTALGTLGYMAPEQIIGKRVDHRADLFAAGVVLYEMVAGRPPFAGATGPDLALAILSEDPDPLPEGTPPALARIVQHALDKEPTRRFQSARDLLFSLEALGDAPASAPSAPPSRWRALAWGLAAVATLAATVRLVAHGPGPAPVPASFTRVTFARRLIHTARLLHDGRSFVFDVWNRDEPGGVYLGRTGEGDNAPLVPDALLLAASTSDELAVLRSAHVIAYPLVEGTLARVGLTGGAPRDVAEHVTWADWSPDGHDLAVVRRDAGQSLIDYAGRTLYATAHPLGAAQVAPDGQHLAVVEYEEPGDDRGRVVVLGLDGDKRPLTGEHASVGNIVWSADGREVFFSAGASVVSRQVRAVSMGGAERTIVAGAQELNLEDVGSDGRLLVRSGAVDIYYFARGPGASSDQAVSLSEFDSARDLSPDGRFLVMAVQGRGAQGDYVVYSRPTDGGPPTRLGEGQDPHYSPDGNWLVTTSAVDRARLSLLPVGPGASRTLPAGSLVARWSPAFIAPDRIVFAGNEADHPSRLYVQKLDGSDPQPISAEGYDLPHRGMVAVSPDGREVLARDPSLRPTRLPLDGGPARPILGLRPRDVPFQWTQDGAALYVFVPESPRVEVDLVDLATGRRALWRELGIGAIGGAPWLLTEPPLVTRDGSAWAYRFVVGASDLYTVKVPAALR